MKLSIFVKKFIFVVVLSFFFLPVNSEEKKMYTDEHSFNFYSEKVLKSSLLGILAINKEKVVASKAST